MQDYKDQAAANADKSDKHLRHLEDKLDQLIHNLTVVVAENEKCKMSLNMCMNELADKTR